MSADSRSSDAVVIGGGFYGTVLAIYLAKHPKFRRVVLLEQERQLFAHASFNNQARIHNGYHYPRSFTTAFRSRVNLPRFVRDWPDAVTRDFNKLYAVARRNSHVTGRQFKRFCDEIGAKLTPAPLALKKLFNHHLIEEVFSVEEYAFNAARIATWANEELQQNGVEIRMNTRATAISRNRVACLSVATTSGGAHESISAHYVFNCTYSGLNHLQGDFRGTTTRLRHEITEMALLRVPSPLRDVGITVMDGPFFSLMPFPAKGLHTLSHVRYTPHFGWLDTLSVNPYERLASYERTTRQERMVRDTARYLPAILDAEYVESLYETKTVLVKNDGDDGRPILFERHSELPGLYSVLGGKLDNVYDVLEKIEHELS